MASGAAPKARRRGSPPPTRTTRSPPPSAAATAPTYDRRRPSPPATFLLRPRNRCTHLFAPLQPSCPDGPHRGQGWQKAGQSRGSCGGAGFCSSPPPARSALESGFPRSFLSGAVFGDRLAGLLASCAERSR
jgi:hypothetical protein